MMRIALAAAALTMIAAPAFAQSVPTTVTLNAQVSKQCGVGNHLSGGTQSFAQSAPVTLADANGQFAGESGIELGFGNFWCNTPGKVTLSASRLQTAAPIANDNGSFTNVFDLSIKTGAAIYWGAAATTPYNTAGSDGILNGTGANTLGAFESGTGQYSRLTVDVLANAQNKRPIAGTYVGSVTLTVAPAA